MLEDFEEVKAQIYRKDREIKDLKHKLKLQETELTLRNTRLVSGGFLDL